MNFNEVSYCFWYLGKKKTAKIFWGKIKTFRKILLNFQFSWMSFSENIVQSRTVPGFALVNRSGLNVRPRRDKRAHYNTVGRNKNCQKLSKYVKNWQKIRKNAKNCQRMSKLAFWGWMFFQFCSIRSLSITVLLAKIKTFGKMLLNFQFSRKILSKVGLYMVLLW